MFNKKSKEQKDLKIEILEKLSTLMTAGFGLVAALACLPAEAQAERRA